jgi:glycerol-3-phosphate O-acyltransferase
MRSRLVDLARRALMTLVRFEASGQEAVREAAARRMSTAAGEAGTAAAVDAPPDPAPILCYVLPVRQITALLVLEEATRRLGLPGPLQPIEGAGLRERHGYFFLSRRGQPSPLGSTPYRYPPRLARLAAAAREADAPPLQVVPVSVFFGRAPRQQESLLKVMVADAWSAPGLFTQLLRVLIHGRQTLIRFSPPIALADLLIQTRADATAATQAPAPAHAADPASDQRRVARALRAQFRLERELAIGPNLSHRQTLIGALIDSSPVRAQIAAQAGRAGITPAQAELQARRMAVGIASDYAYPVIRVWDVALTALWTRIYRGVSVHGFETLARTAAGAQLVWLPCHRSHVDYLLLSWIIHHRGLQIPHIAAGENLDIPVAGTLLRRAGAFFMRRSFRDDPLYGAVFAQYLHELLRRGYPIEYFVEGGRSRTGLTLPARAGLLSMTVDSFLREPVRPQVLLPVYIGYEQVIESASHAAELAGGRKSRETLAGALRAVAALRKRDFGRVHVNLGEPVMLTDLLEQHWPQWREAQARAAAEPGGEPGGDPQAGPQGEARRASPRGALIEALAQTVTERINQAVVIGPVNLLAMALPGADKAAIDEDELHARIGQLKALATANPMSPRQVLTGDEPAAVIALGLSQGLIRRQSHPLGDLILVIEERRHAVDYARHNVLHAFAEAGLIAGLLAQGEGSAEAAPPAAALGLHPLLRTELFLGDDGRPPAARLQACLDALGRDAPSGPPSRHRWLAAPVAPLLLRWALVASLLEGLASDPPEARLVEDCALMVAERMALLDPASAARLPQRAALRQALGTLQSLGHVTQIEGRLSAQPSLADLAAFALRALPPRTAEAIAQAGRRPPAALLAAAQAPNRRR